MDSYELMLLSAVNLDLELIENEGEGEDADFLGVFCPHCGEPIHFSEVSKDYCWNRCPICEEDF